MRCRGGQLSRGRRRPGGGLLLLPWVTLENLTVCLTVFVFGELPSFNVGMDGLKLPRLHGVGGGHKRAGAEVGVATGVHLRPDRLGLELWGHM
jgi:hypothetical protein